MSQKILISVLGILIVGVIGVGVYSALPQNSVAPDVTNEITLSEPIPNPQPQVNAQNTVGDVWAGKGTIIEIDANGITVALSETTSVYVELGPTDFWQSQGITLNIGDDVTVDGWNNGEQIHARVIEVDGEQLMLRAETSQPLWSGGASQEQNGTRTHDTESAGTGQTTFQVAPEDWLTISGTLLSVTNGTIQMETADGTVYDLQMGQPNFWQSQGVILTIGDAVEVLGFWMNDQFTVGDITKTATGEHIILRDPNGRQLWGGPGRNANNSRQQPTQTTADGQ